MTLDLFAAQFHGDRAGNAYKAVCPAHNDSTEHPSLSIFQNEQGRLCVKCFHGCAPVDIYKAAGVAAPDGRRRTTNGASPLGDPVASYEYVDEHGVLRAVKRRYVPKDFRWVYPDGTGGWRSGSNGYRGLFRLPELRKAPAEATIYVTEGEKSVVLLQSLGLTATCGYTGAESPWFKHYGKCFNGHPVVIFADQDDAGQQFATRWAQHIATAGATSVTLVLYLPLVPKGGDIYDWVEDHQPPSASVITDFVRTAGMSFIAQTQAPEDFPNTESGDAEFFAQVHGDDIRYDHRRGRFLIADPSTGLWLPDQMTVIVSLAKDAIRERQRCALALTDSDRKKTAMHWALNGESRNRLTNLLALAESTEPVRDDGAHWDEHPFLLGTQNGVVDLRTGAHRRALPAERVTRRVRAALDAAARCPLWEKTLREIFAVPPSGDLLTRDVSTDKTSEMVGFLQRALGYSITGDCRDECAFFCHGDGCNGKGVIVNTVGWLLADYTADLPFAALEVATRGQHGVPTPELAALDGARFVTIAELNALTLNEARFKALTGRDPITARFLHQNPFTFLPVDKPWISCNETPKIVGIDDAIWRRIFLIPFRQSFVGRENKHLKDELRLELPGILNWLIAGAIAWQRDGLEPPAAVRAATSAFREESNVLKPFLEAMTYPKPGGAVSGLEMFAAYQRYCDGNVEREERLGYKKFFLTLARLLKKDEDTHTREVRYRGVSLKGL